MRPISIWGNESARARVFVCVCIYMCACVRACVRACVCVCVKDRQTDRRRERKRDGRVRLANPTTQLSRLAAIKQALGAMSNNTIPALAWQNKETKQNKQKTPNKQAR